MANDAWTGARLGDMNDAPLGGAYLAEVVKELAPWTVPHFTTTADRDAALTAWTAAGNTAKDGMHCTVTGTGLMVYSTSGGWTLEAPKLPTFRVYRSGPAIPYSSSSLVNIPYDARDDVYGYNPGSAFFTAALSSADRRVQCLAGGLYYFKLETVGTGLISGTRIGLMTGPNTMGVPIANRPDYSCEGVARLSAGDYVGGAVIQSASDQPDGTNGFKNHLIITRLSA